MRTEIRTIFFVLFALLFSGKEAWSVFPLPVPLIGNDISNNIADLGENMNAIAEEVEQAEAAMQKTVEELKSGSFGFDAIKNYTNTLKNIDIKRAIPEVTLPKELAGVVNDTDLAKAFVEENYAKTYSKEGQHTTQAKINNQKSIELLQNNIAALYAHALAVRVKLAKEREQPDITLESKDTREILQGNRALSEILVKRWNDIVFMESQISEYESTLLMSRINRSEGDFK